MSFVEVILEDINVYSLLSSNYIKTYCTISSGSLYEAKFFGKNIKYLYKPQLDYIEDFEDNQLNIKNNFSNIYIPIYKSFFSSIFWSNILC